MLKPILDLSQGLTKTLVVVFNNCKEFAPTICYIRCNISMTKRVVWSYQRCETLSIVANIPDRNYPALNSHWSTFGSDNMLLIHSLGMKNKVFFHLLQFNNIPHEINSVLYAMELGHSKGYTLTRGINAGRKHWLRFECQSEKKGVGEENIKVNMPIDSNVFGAGSFLIKSWNPVKADLSSTYLQDDHALAGFI